MLRGRNLTTFWGQHNVSVFTVDVNQDDRAVVYMDVLVDICKMGNGEWSTLKVVVKCSPGMLVTW